MKTVKVQNKITGAICLAEYRANRKGNMRYFVEEEVKFLSDKDFDKKYRIVS